MVKMVVSVQGDHKLIDAGDALRIALTKIINKTKLDKDSLVPISTVPDGLGFVVMVGLREGVETPSTWREKGLVVVE